MLKRTNLLLLGAILLAVAFRMATWGYPYFPEVDPFHHYRIAEYLAMTGEMPVIWPLSLAPIGGAITEPAWFYWISMVVYRLLEPVGLSFLQAFKLAPAIFGALSVIPAYLIAREVFDEEAALCSAVILAVLPAAVYRSSAGFYRGDVFAVFFGLWGLYLILRVIILALPLIVLGAWATRALNTTWEHNPVLGWVNELVPPSLPAMVGKFGLLLALAPLGLYHAMHRVSLKVGLFLAWAIASTFLLGVALRFAYLAAFPLAILGGVGISSLRGRPMKAVLLAGVIIVGGVSALAQEPLMSEGWQGALEFLRGQERGIVLSWWDTGSWVQGVTGFPTVVDSVHGQKREHVEAVANVLLSANASNVSGFLRQYGVRYIIISGDLAEHPGAVQSAAYLPAAPLEEENFLYSLAYLEGAGFPVRLIWDQDGVLVYLSEIKFS